ncbi:hypothetical protein CURTO8I2_70044 [Curtobacterium sp. 8I-2]|nr:hypothetical protein CURTO8I2_70044 [Curtobacterium sp. 8I-2]
MEGRRHPRQRSQHDLVAPERQPALQVHGEPGAVDQPQLARGPLRIGHVGVRARADTGADGHQHGRRLGVVTCRRTRGRGRRFEHSERYHNTLIWVNGFRSVRPSRTLSVPRYRVVPRTGIQGSGVDLSRGRRGTRIDRDALRVRHRPTIGALGERAR